GSKALLQVYRRGAYRDISVAVIEFEPDRVASATSREATKPPAAAPGMLGLTVADLTDVQRRELKLKGGVRVEAADGAAARAGVREGDVLLSVDNAEVANVKQFEAVTAKLDKGKAVTLLVRRGEAVNFVIVRPAR
ncbi:MAG: PDZ domain-containing protein, partial [Rhizobiales bacterium]|nr:PDZ domain-containing protein [Rhizobacter sp.]